MINTALERRLYRMADTVFETKIWEKLDSSQLFAFELSNGEIGYVTIAGSPSTNKDIDIGLFMGTDALKSYFDYEEIQTAFKDNEFKMSGGLFGQDAVHLTFLPREFLERGEYDKAVRYSGTSSKWNEGEVLFTKFYRNFPNYYLVDQLENEDMGYLLEALEAVCEVSERLVKKNSGQLGFSSHVNRRGVIPYLKRVKGGYKWYKTAIPKDVAYVHKTAPFEDEILKAKLLSQPRRYTTFQADLIRSPLGVYDKDFGDLEYFYAMLFLCDPNEGIIWTVMDSEKDSEDQGHPKLLDKLGKDFVNFKFVPSKIEVADKRTYALLEDFCRKVGIKLELKDYLAEIDMEERDFYEEMTVRGPETLNAAMNSILNMVSVESVIKALNSYLAVTFDSHGISKDEFNVGLYKRNPSSYIRSIIKEEAETYGIKMGPDYPLASNDEYFTGFMGSIIDTSILMSNMINNGANYKSPFLIDIGDDADDGDDDIEVGLPGNWNSKSFIDQGFKSLEDAYDEYDDILEEIGDMLTPEEAEELNTALNNFLLNSNEEFIDDILDFLDNIDTEGGDYDSAMDDVEFYQLLKLFFGLGQDDDDDDE